jgi:hypothetical protein
VGRRGGAPGRRSASAKEAPELELARSGATSPRVGASGCVGECGAPTRAPARAAPLNALLAELVHIGGLQRWGLHHGRAGGRPGGPPDRERSCGPSCRRRAAATAAPRPASLPHRTPARRPSCPLTSLPGHGLRAPAHRRIGASAHWLTGSRPERSPAYARLCLAWGRLRLAERGGAAGLLLAVGVCGDRARHASHDVVVAIHILDSWRPWRLTPICGPQLSKVHIWARQTAG